MTKKSVFLGVLLEIISEVPKLIFDALPRESLEYKMMRIAGINPKQCYQGFYHLKQRKIIKFHEGNFQFTKMGRKWLENSKFRYFRIKNKKWDGHWRVILFDIPQTLHNKRTDLRRKLKSLNFYQLQKSVFIFPFSCEEELADFCRYLKIGEYIDILRVSRLGFKEEEIKQYYKNIL